LGGDFGQKLAKINVGTGTLDSGFLSSYLGFNAPVYSIAVGLDGLFVGGDFTALIPSGIIPAPVIPSNLVKLNFTTGDPDSNFTTGFSDQPVYSLLYDSRTSQIFAGWGNSSDLTQGGISAFATSNLGSGFSKTATGAVRAIVPYSAGVQTHLLMGGDFLQYGGTDILNTVGNAVTVNPNTGGASDEF
jgi:hypothetical protein